MPETHPLEERELVRALLMRSGRLLDDGRYEEFVDLFSKDGKYLLQARSDELGRDMTWLTANRDELASLFKEYPQHVRDKAYRTHLVAPDEILLSTGAGKAVSTFAVFRTDLAGRSALYAVGRYEDELVVEGGTWKFKCRRTMVTTRQFSTPTPLPL